MSGRKEALEALRDKVRAGELPRPLPFTVAESAAIIGAFNGSLDAAKALHSAVLPDYQWDVGLGKSDLKRFMVRKYNPAVMFDGVDANPARAWLLAILSALISDAKE